ncbi:ATP-binding protein [Mesorhizobium sp. M0119]|uniref:ATP-binding protein n=1 Tax=Mesorhizobium sp. M0119 TaxID=2956885 RepID=UPI00333658B4
MTRSHAYRKVFTKTKFGTAEPLSFTIDHKLKRVLVGSRDSDALSALFMGKVLESGRSANILDYDVYIDVKFPHVVGIFGSRGSGKSFDLGVFVEGLFLDELMWGTPNSGQAAIIFDIQDQFWTLQHEPQATIPQDASHRQALEKWGISPNSVNGLQIWIPNGSDTQVPNARPLSLSPAQLTKADWLSILELDRFSPMGQALISLLENATDATPAELVDRCSAGVLQNYQQGTVDGLRWRLISLQEAGVINAEGLEVDQLLAPGTLSVILMRNLHDSIRALIVGVIARLVADRMGRIQQARKIALRTNTSMVDSEKLARRLWLVLDEAHVLVPSGASTPATGPMIDYVKRGRDAGLSLVFATQQPSAVDNRLMSQVDLTLTHTLGFEIDLSAATARMPTRTAVDYDIDSARSPNIADVVRSLSPGEALVADASSGRVFLCHIRPRATAHGGNTPG